LKALYVFDEGDGTLIHDNSGAETPTHLEIQNPSAVRWLAGRGLKIKGSTVITSNEVPSALINSITSTNEITLEAWIRPAAMNQSGPARIISLSKNVVNRAFTLGQEGDNSVYNYAVRLNTSSTDANGLPAVATADDFNSIDLHHVVYTRKSNGEEMIFVNGKNGYTGTRSGVFSSFGNEYYLSIANEISGDRPWNGTYYLLAVYNKALSPSEINKNYVAGLGEIRFTTQLLVEPNATYLVTPFTRTENGVQYGITEVLLHWSNNPVFPSGDTTDPNFHGVER
jgi:hypothetical protein